MLELRNGIAQFIEGPGLPLVAVLYPPVACPRCRKACSIVVNRWGKTLCASCDEEVNAECKSRS